MTSEEEKCIYICVCVVGEAQGRGGGRDNMFFDAHGVRRGRAEDGAGRGEKETNPIYVEYRTMNELT